MNKLIIGNIIMLIACIIMTIAGLPKKKSTCLVLQNTQIFLASIGNLFFQSYPGCIINLLSVIRNILSQKEKLTVPIKIILSILVVVISLCFNNIGVLVIFPLTSFISYIFLMNTKNDIVFKLVVISSSVLWLIYDLSLMMYINAFFEVATIITNCIGIYRIKKTYEQKNSSKI